MNQTVPYFNPATNEKIGEINTSSETVVRSTVLNAQVAFKSWSKTTLQQRLSHLKKGKQYLIENMEAIVDAISKNNGKPRVEALMADVYASIAAINYYLREAKNILADEHIPVWHQLPTKKAYISYSPLGVIGIISPWNYPFAIPMSEIIASLVAGNTVVIKPSEVTSLVNKHIQAFANACELPTGVFNMIEGDGATGAALASSALQKIIFTGSVPTGKKVMKAAADNLVPVSLELGGKDPCIVFEDVDLDIATSGVLAGGYYNNGQTCCSFERLIVHESISEEFIKLLSFKIEKLRVGPSTSYENEIGPITYPPQKTVIKSQLDMLKIKNNYDGQNAFMRPTLVKASESDTIWVEETFGPVLAWTTFQSEDEAIAKANKNKFGLGAAVWSKNHHRALRVAKQIEAGTVVINDAPYTNAMAALPWGGVKESGVGSVHGRDGLRDLCLKRVISYDIQGQAKQFWWFPYGQTHYNFLKHFALASIESNWFKKIGHLTKMISMFLKMPKRL